MLGREFFHLAQEFLLLGGELGLPLAKRGDAVNEGLNAWLAHAGHFSRLDRFANHPEGPIYEQRAAARSALALKLANSFDFSDDLFEYVGGLSGDSCLQFVKLGLLRL